jgi:hypothetical protein
MANMNVVISQLERQRKQAQQELSRLDAALSALRGLNGSSRTGGRGFSAMGRPRRKISAAGRRRIAEAQRARWAKLRQQKKS